MQTPFPGMDPYLERPGLWKEVHTGLISAIQRFLTPLLRPRYRVAVERRTFLALLTPEISGDPDLLILPLHPKETGSFAVATTTGGIAPRVVQLPMPEEVKERYLEIRDVKTGEVITVIELLSPTNKLNNDGRKEYEAKRLSVLRSDTNLVEIDLLRAGKPFPMFDRKGDMESDYRIIISRAEYRPNADAYLFSVQDPIPDIPIPLRPDENEPLLLLNQILHQLYDEAGYDLAIDYTQPPTPQLKGKDTVWAKELLGQM